MVDTSIDDSETVESSPDVIVSVGLDGKSYHRPAPSEPAEDMSPVPVKTATRPTVHAHHPNTTRPEQCGCGMSVKPTPPPASRSNANSHDNTRTTGKRYQSIRHICQKYANLCRKQLINAKLRLARNVVISTKTATLQRIPDVSSPHSHQRKGLEPKGSGPFAFPESLFSGLQQLVALQDSFSPTIRRQGAVSCAPIPTTTPPREYPTMCVDRRILQIQ